MRSDSFTSEFASPARSSKEEIKRQSTLLSRFRYFKRITAFVPDPILVLNSNRQVVFSNPAAVKLVKKMLHDDPIGLRPGEALLCEHARKAVCGCGTTTFCRYCGALKAILSSLNGSEDIQECLVNQESGDTLLFICYTYPFPIKNENFSLFILKDISKERRVQILEHVFFHDIKNLLTAFIGWVDLLKDTDTPEKARQISTTLTQLGIEISNEINAQEQLVSAETNELTVKLEKVDSLSLLKEIKNLYTKSDISSGKKINIDSQTVAVKLTVDVSILQRVLGNMVKNALEATSEGSVITLGALHNGDHICFWVHNPGFIPIEVQAQIFKWSFSTKGKGRGLGTYSMKLLSSRYLGGTVRFESSLEKGTVFEVKLPLYYK